MDRDTVNQISRTLANIATQQVFEKNPLIFDYSALDEIEGNLEDIYVDIAEHSDDRAVIRRGWLNIKDITDQLFREVGRIDRTGLSKTAILKTLEEFYGKLIEDDIEKLAYTNHPSFDNDSAAASLVYELVNYFKAKMIQVAVDEWVHRYGTSISENRGVPSISEGLDMMTFREKINQIFTRYLGDSAHIIESIEAISEE